MSLLLIASGNVTIVIVLPVLFHDYWVTCTNIRLVFPTNFHNTLRSTPQLF